MTHWIQEKPKNIEIRFAPNTPWKIIEETEKTWRGDYWTFLNYNQKTGEWVLKIIEMYHPEYETPEEKAENLKILEEIRSCGGLDGYLMKLMKNNIRGDK